MDPVAPLCDFTDGVIYLFEGEYAMVGASAVAIIPIAGTVGKQGAKTYAKTTKQGLKTASKAALKVNLKKLTNLSASTFNKKITRDTANKLINFSEKVGGHTIERHVAKSDEFLKNRVKKNLETQFGKIPPATSFKDLATAQKALRDALTTELGKKKIKEVIRLSREGKKNSKDSLSFVVRDISDNLGYGYVSIGNNVEKISKKLTNVRVVLQPDGKGGYFIVTIYPFN